MTVRIYISMITLNLNGLNAPINTHRVAGWILTSVLKTHRD